MGSNEAPSLNRSALRNAYLDDNIEAKLWKQTFCHFTVNVECPTRVSCKLKSSPQ